MKGTEEDTNTETHTMLIKSEKYGYNVCATHTNLQIQCCCCCCCSVASVVSDSVQPHRQQPARLPRPWDPPGKNTGVACHFLLQCMKGKSQSEVAQSCLTLSNPMDCSLPGSSVHGIFTYYIIVVHTEQVLYIIINYC